MFTDGSEPTNLTNSPDSDEFASSWAPDESRVVFDSDRDGNWNLYSMSPNGGPPTRLTSGTWDETGPRWRP